MTDEHHDTYGFKAPAKLPDCAQHLQPIIGLTFERRSSAYRGNYYRAEKPPATFILQSNFVEGEGLTLPHYGDYVVLFFASNIVDPEPLRKLLAELRAPAELLWRTVRRQDGTTERLELKNGVLTSVGTHRAPELKSSTELSP